MAVSLSGWLVISNRCTDRREKWVSRGGQRGICESTAGKRVMLTFRLALGSLSTKDIKMQAVPGMQKKKGLDMVHLANLMCRFFP